MLEVVHFTKQKTRFAIKAYHIKGLEDAEMGSVLITDDARIEIDEPFVVAYDRINGLEPCDEKAMCYGT
jgi:hypothetical protein